MYNPYEVREKPAGMDSLVSLDPRRIQCPLMADPKTGMVYSYYHGRVLKPSGTKCRLGYIQLKMYRPGSDVMHTVMAHRAIWEAVNGPIPDGMEIDHINMIRDDNRIENLRLVTLRENRLHRRYCAKKVGKSGVPGVHWFEPTKKWCSVISCQGKRWQKYGSDKDAVYAWYYSMKKKLHGESSLAGMPKPIYTNLTPELDKIGKPW